MPAKLCLHQSEPGNCHNINFLLQPGIFLTNEIKIP